MTAFITGRQGKSETFHPRGPASGKVTKTQPGLHRVLEDKRESAGGKGIPRRGKGMCKGAEVQGSREQSADHRRSGMLE